jgi:hypothetical protein
VPGGYKKRGFDKSCPGATDCFRNAAEAGADEPDAAPGENPVRRSGASTAIARILLLLAICASPPTLHAQTASEELKLEEEFTDPLTTLPQLTVRDAYTPAMYGTDLEANDLIVRPIIPRIPPQTLLPFFQLIRPTFRLATLPSPTGGTITGFGDLPVFDIAVLPWPDRKKTGVLLGVGPALVFPTANERSLGQGAWQAGPAFGAAYTGIPGLLVGVIVQNPISFAYTSPDRPPQNTLQVQPILAVHLYDGWYLRSAEATWTIGWHHNTPTMIPLSLGLGRTFVRAGLPPMSFFVTGEWMVYRQFAPVAPQTTINFGMTVAFPQFRDWVVRSATR